MNCPHCGKETGMTYYLDQLRHRMDISAGKPPDVVELRKQGLCTKCGGTLEPYGGLSLRCTKCGEIGVR